MTNTDSPRSLDLPVAGMTCAACAARIERVLNRLPGVTANVNLASERAHVELVGEDAADAGDVVASIRKAGFEVPGNELERVRAELPRLMSEVAALRVPLLVDIGVGANWDQAH